MAKCMYCSELVESIGTKPKKYCSDRCRKAYKRRVEQTDKITNGRMQTDKVKGGTCWCCGATIAKILVCCQECAWSGKAAAKRASIYPPLLTDRTPGQMETDLHALRPTGNHRMTVMERLFYRPAHQLLPGETNFVSLPGRACYGIKEKKGVAS